MNENVEAELVIEQYQLLLQQANRELAIAKALIKQKNKQIQAMQEKEAK